MEVGSRNLRRFCGDRDMEMFLVVSQLDQLSMQSLSDRQRDIRFYLCLVQGRAAGLPMAPGDQPRGPEDLVVHDLKQSLAWLRFQLGSINMCPTICPHASVFVRGGRPRQNCLVVPEEMFLLMGYDFQEHGLEVELVETRAGLTDKQWLGERAHGIRQELA